MVNDEKVYQRTFNFITCHDEEITSLARAYGVPDGWVSFKMETDINSTGVMITASWHADSKGNTDGK